MLTENEQDDLIRQICATAETMGREIKPATAVLMVGDLSRYSYNVICRALARVRAEQTGSLTLNAIITRIDDGSQHPGANEAWAQSLPAATESNTVVWTKEMSQAWSVAQPVLELGDRVGARMVFIQSYERLVATATAEGRTPEWHISQGWDADQRISAVSKAVAIGQLPAPIAEKFLPSPERTSNPEGKRRIADKIHQMVNVLAADRRQREHERKKRIQADRGRRLREFEEQYARELAEYEQQQKKCEE